MISIRSFFRQPSVPKEYRSNFVHLYFDMAWFGILSGSAINFLNIYAARLGATGFQIGLLGATSALVNLVFTMPAGQMLARRPVGRTIFWTSVIYRIGFLLWIPLPWIFGRSGQVWALIVLSLLMGVPFTVLSVGFNALFAAAVPGEWRAYVVGIRNVLLSITYIVSALGSGWLLEHLPFPAGYQVVFGIGALGAMMSSLHLFFIRTEPRSIPDREPAAAPEVPAPRPGWRAALRTDILRTPFTPVLLVMLALHLTQYLAIPIFPLYNVNALNLNDEQIGIGTALFYLACLVGSTQLNRIVRRLGHHKVTGFGFMAMSLYPFFLGLSRHAAGYYLVSVAGGLGWSLVGGAYANYLLEAIPEGDRPAHLAWYNLVLNASILAGSLIGPLIAGAIGLGFALLLFGVFRLLAGIAILKWGRIAAPGAEPLAAGVSRADP